MITKALILAAGKGTRLKPLTDSIAKHLLPVGNKPILFYAIEQIREAGISDIGIVISPETGPDIRLALGDGSRWETKISYIVQSQPLGLAHAVKTAKYFLDDLPFLLFLGDNLIKDGVKDLVAQFDHYFPDALIVLKKVPNPSAFGVAEIDISGQVVRAVEKPKKPKTNLALVGVYIFNAAVHKAINSLRPSWRGEYEITDAIRNLLNMGKKVRSHILKGWWLDTGRKEDLLQANRIILDEKLKYEIKGKVDVRSAITGPVDIGEGTEIESSQIHGPVLIAEGCHIINSFIGPYTSIGPRTIIKSSSIEFSIVLDDVYIVNTQLSKAKIITKNMQL